MSQYRWVPEPLNVSVRRLRFERGYADRSGITMTTAYQLGLFPVQPCDCGEDICEGWRRRYRDLDG